MAVRPIPILLYHAVSDDPPRWLAPWSLPPEAFEAQLETMLEAGCTPLTVSQLVDAFDGLTALPERPVVVTFDDGYDNTLSVAAPAMADRGIPSTTYITTGALADRPPVPDLRMQPAKMLRWSQLAELESMGVELGAHAHTHAQVDTLRRSKLRQEVELPKKLLEEHLGHAVRSYAYPHGYSNPAVRRLVAETGYDSACGVRNTLSFPQDDRFSLARLTVLRTTPLPVVADWVTGRGAKMAPDHEWRRTQLWRMTRRIRAAVRPEPRRRAGGDRPEGTGSVAGAGSQRSVADPAPAGPPLTVTPEPPPAGGPPVTVTSSEPPTEIGRPEPPAVTGAEVPRPATASGA